MLYYVCRLDSDTGRFLDSVDDSDASDSRGLCSWLAHLRRIPRMEELIQKEIAAVENISSLKIAKLRRATDIHCGLEVFHLFVLDLLGVRKPSTHHIRENIHLQLMLCQYTLVIYVCNREAYLSV